MVSLEGILDREIRRGMMAITLALTIASGVMLTTWNALVIGGNLANLKGFLELTVTNSQIHEEPIIIQRSLENFWASTKTNAVFSSLRVSMDNRPVAEVGDQGSGFMHFTASDSFVGLGKKIFVIEVVIDGFAILLQVCLVVAFFLIFGTAIYRYRKFKLIRRVGEILDPLSGEIEKLLKASALSNFDENQRRIERQPHSIAEFEKLATAYDQVLDSFAAYSALKEASSMVELAKQVSHDIRSPVMALSLVLRQSAELAPDKKVLAKDAIDRIMHISKSLLSEAKLRYKNKDSGSGLSSNVGAVEDMCLINNVFESVVQEKRIQYADRCEVQFNVIVADSDKGFKALIPSHDLGSLLSNLISNCYDARTSDRGLDIVLRVRQLDSSFLEISVDDNGATMPTELMRAFNEGRFRSFGKEHIEDSGTGLGLLSAHRLVSVHGGSLSFHALQPGTSVRITLPLIS